MQLLTTDAKAPNDWTSDRTSGSTAVPMVRDAHAGGLSAAERGVQPSGRSASAAPAGYGEDSSEDSTSSSEAPSSSSSSDECGGLARECHVKRDCVWSYMAAEGEKAAKRAKHGGPKPQRLPDNTWVTARWWGISRQQIEDFYYECRKDEKWSDEDSAAQFVPKFVKPITDGSGMGLALYKNQDAPKMINVMISHAWQENAKNFFEDILDQLKSFEVAYICFLSNYQGTRDEIDEQLGKDISRSPFTEVLSCISCNRLLVVPCEELKANGEGLYSRLWCDWEIKVAADMGLPIHITQRNELSHLLGSRTASSKRARCGNPQLPANEDEKLIRDAIENKPVENGKFQSLGVFVFSVCVAYGPRVNILLWGPHGIVWIAGYLVGILVGFVVLFGFLRPIRNYLYKMRDQNGYQKLDSIIKAAAHNDYRHRRFRPMIDLPLMAIVALSGGFISFLYHFQVNPEHFTACKNGEGFDDILSGIFRSLLIWPVLHINSIGPWTGVFFLRPWDRFKAGVFLFCMICIGSLMGSLVLLHGHGQGALWGCLVGMASLSLYNRRWKHVAGIMFILCYMVACHFFMLYTNHWLLWHDTILVALGAIGLQMVPGLSGMQRLLAWIVPPCFVVGLAVLSYFSQEVTDCAVRSYFSSR